MQHRPGAVHDVLVPYPEFHSLTFQNFNEVHAGQQGIWERTEQTAYRKGQVTAAATMTIL